MFCLWELDIALLVFALCCQSTGVVLLKQFCKCTKLRIQWGKHIALKFWLSNIQRVDEKTAPPPKYNGVVFEICTTSFSMYLYIVCKNLWKCNVEIIFYYMFSITRSKQVSVTTRTHACSQLSPVKQCDYLSIVVTFFLTKNFN